MGNYMPEERYVRLNLLFWQKEDILSVGTFGGAAEMSC